MIDLLEAPGHVAIDDRIDAALQRVIHRAAASGPTAAALTEAAARAASSSARQNSGSSVIDVVWPAMVMLRLTGPA